MSIYKIKQKSKTAVSLLRHPKRLILPLSQNGMLRWLPDKPAIKLLYWAEMDDHLCIDQPKVFSEKIQWIKLYDRKQRYTSMVDKVKVKEIVASAIGRDFVIPTYAIWDNAKSIDFNALPNEFVMKCNHDSHRVIICKDKSKLDKEAVVRKMSFALRKDAYTPSREWAYKNVDRKVFAEKLIVDPMNDDLIDYKFFCFNGEPIYCQIIKDRSTNETIDFYDMEWNLMDFTGLGTGDGPKRGNYTPKPENYDKMIEIARNLATGTIFVRIDLYNVLGRIYFGEFTLYPKSGLGWFYPYEWNLALGDLINIHTGK